MKFSQEGFLLNLIKNNKNWIKKRQQKQAHQHATFTKFSWLIFQYAFLRKANPVQQHLGVYEFAEKVKRIVGMIL